ncbi:polysaccharide deacetylase family protein [Actinoplanes sp. TBRC 11911]|uniref:polysaccharide deacetylase family protein n=1 Tax=Actinoplanes sp. TBRC 11911 TaxID=2729386 RepID=UPI00145E5B8C|nr:polysaccharide deacetylase family protein [Actinoplanes sp. TBRC 11911]NMO50969.1 polysaccharide deacetylase family protein [Actinoplanes sp. TBRC 11911]
MRLARSRKIVLLGVVLLAAGLAGRASADTTQNHPATALPAVSASAPAPKPKPKPTTKPAPTKKQTATPPSKPSSRQFSLVGVRMTTGSKAVALTFDDGPDPVQTPKILKLLAQQHVKATFCLVGSNVQKHPEIVRQIAAGGHTLCNHTWNHSLTIGKQSEAAMKADLQRTSNAIHQAAPKAKLKYFRAPGGNFTPALVATAKQLGMASLYWKVDPRDWDHPKGETHAQHQQRVINRVCHNTGSGAIVLSHDFAQPDTIAAYRKIIPTLKKKYKLVAMP